MAHGHHGHDHGAADVGSRVLLVAILLNGLLTIAQVVAGLIAGSVALLADALHNGSDAAALGIAWVARKISRRRADHAYTFGYRRAEMLGAMINLTALVLIALYLAIEAVRRLLDPGEVLGGWVMAAAGLALVVDLGTVLLLWSQSKGNLNFRAAFLHNLTDAGTSLVVLGGGAMVFWLGWNWVDPVLTLVLAGFIGWQAVGMLRQTVRMLMEGTPVGLDLDELARSLCEEAHVCGIHHLHVWELGEQHPALEAHVVIERSSAQELEVIKARLKQKLSERYGIGHSTLEFEFAGEGSPCAQGGLIAGSCS